MTNCSSRLFALTVLAGGIIASAGAQVFDRGLPTLNLNNAAGANRSNVGWADTAGFYGDNFTLSGSDTYAVTGIRTWLVIAQGANSPAAALGNLTLMLGQGVGANLNSTAYTYSATKVTYSDSSTYQGWGGGIYDIWQLDWNTAGLNINGGDLWNFAIKNDNSNYVFLHSSNGPLSGSTQDGADGLMGEWDASGNFLGNFNSNGNGWDKGSDANVQVFARVVTPEPFTMSLGIAGAGLFIRRRMKAKKS